MNAADFPRMEFNEALEKLASMPAFIEAALEVASPDELVYRPGEDEFSLVEHACHLRDLEREGYLARVRRILAEDRPDLAGFDGAAIARSRNYLGEDAHRAAREFAAARREVLALIAPLGEAELAREATFEGKRICLADLVAMMAAHDQGHREEIEALADALESP